MFLDLIPRTSAKFTPEDHDAFFEGQFAKTLGNLIQTLKLVATLPEDLEAALAQSNKRRAYLAHHFFREASDDVHLGKYEKLLEQLEQNRSFFQDTDTKLQEFVKPVMLRYGFNNEMLSKAMHEFRSIFGVHPNHSFEADSHAAAQFQRYISRRFLWAYQSRGGWSAWRMKPGKNGLSGFAKG